MTLDGNGGRHVAYQDITHGRLVMESLDSAACRPNWANPQNKLPGSKHYGAYTSIGISGTTQETAQQEKDTVSNCSVTVNMHE